MARQQLTRITPTPSGYLHTGNAFSFLLTERYALENNASILLRIDDMDAERKRPEYVQDVFDSLNWLGIKWQLGPKDAADFETSWSQRHRLHLYNAAIDQLTRENKLYACRCSRKQLQEKGACTCASENLALDTPDTALRIRLPGNTMVHFTDNNGKQQVNLNETIGPFIVRRRDGLPAYQLFSLVDDLHFNTSVVFRGADLFHSTAAQIFLSEQLGYDIRSNISFVHHPLITDEQGHKLSKSEGALSLKALRERGMSANELRAQFHNWYRE